MVFFFLACLLPGYALAHIYLVFYVHVIVMIMPVIVIVP